MRVLSFKSRLVSELVLMSNPNIVSPIFIIQLFDEFLVDVGRLCYPVYESVILRFSDQFQIIFRSIFFRK